MFISGIDNLSLIRKEAIKVISLKVQEEDGEKKHIVYFYMDGADDYLSESYSSLDKANARMVELRDLLCFK